MAEEIRRTNVVSIAAIRATWRRRCIEAFARHTAETKRLIRQHSITIDPTEDDEGAA
jgi:hypothetical protein